jgi:hypothetical protein
MWDAGYEMWDMGYGLTDFHHKDTEDTENGHKEAFRS